jgi:hypothetical protein
MSAILWGILAIAAGLAGLIMAAWLRRPRLPPLPPGTELPTTPLQRLARWGLFLGVLPGIAAAAMVLLYGGQRIYDDARRLIFTLLLLAMIVIFLVVTVQLTTWVRRAD